MPTIIPFLKWPGGKRWLVANHSSLFPKTYKRYYEPFLGGGAVYFYLQPEAAVLSDTNAELIAAYKAIAWRRRQVEKLLSVHDKKHELIYYYKIRGMLPHKAECKAARTLYLNRTCFNGIYRVNRDGVFNVPIGSKTSVVLDSDDFLAMAKILRQAKFRVSDFEPVIDEAVAEDLIFADPPYTVRHNNNGFVKYNEKLFSWADQERLAKCLMRAADRGVKILTTNANHSEIRDLYSQPTFITSTVERYSSISSDSASRRAYRELVIRANCD